jgi:hypothetical protein
VEDVSIGVELDKDILHPKLSMKLSDEEDWPMDAALMGVYNVLLETEKEKLHGRSKSFPPSNSPDVLISPWSTHATSFPVLLLLSKTSGWDLF